jgi:hypothetical protein
MSNAAATAELRASRPWVLTMSILALCFLALWCLFTLAVWFVPNNFPKNPIGLRYLFLGFFAQLTLFVGLAIFPFVLLFRYALALFALKDADDASLARAIDLNVRFWRQCSWLMWGAVWLLAYLILGGLLVGAISGKL